MWILDNGIWLDVGIWDDGDVWQDYPEVMFLSGVLAAIEYRDIARLMDETIIPLQQPGELNFGTRVYVSRKALLRQHH